MKRQYKKFSLLSIRFGVARIIFWLTVGLLLAFSMTPKGYAQAAEVGSSTPTVIPETVPIVIPESTGSGIPFVKKFIVSSYYTPLPDQAHYFRGSFEADVRLNGEGIHAADGTKVYLGIAAAPPNIPFGTKMEIPGFGIVAIHDRGGAIKNNRIDIWVGEGEVGLQRALGWGMRTLDVTVYGVDENKKEAVNLDGIPLADLSKFLLKTKHFTADLGEEDEGPEVLELQRFLRKLGYFQGEVTGYFGTETVAAVTAFQLEQKVIVSPEDPGAGNFGPRSRVTLENLLQEKRASNLAKIPQPPLGKGDRGTPVSELQEILRGFGFLKSDGVTGIFDETTAEALVRFQIDTGAVSKSTDFGAGFYGPKTKTAVHKFVSDSFTPFTDLAILGSASSPKSKTTLSLEKALSSGDTGHEVLFLQEELRRLNFFGLTPTGNFGKTTEHAVFKFQQTFGVVENESSEGAGVVGPKTLEKLNDIVAARSHQQRQIAKTSEEREIVVSRISDERIIAAAGEATGAFGQEISFGNRGSEVQKLQKMLKKLGFFPGRFTTEYFGPITKESVMSFQKSHGLVESGMLDETTRKMLNRITVDA